jgi:2,3-diketo-5-methylthio-1-phosphopentane phosphatase
MTAAPVLAVFCDFDGTFARQDVGSTLAARYAADRRPAQWARYERGEITAWEYNLEILEGLPVGLDVLEEFLATVELDTGARSLLAWCEARSVPFRILSDGFDWNLDRLQALNGIRFAYTANHLRIEHGKWRIRAGAPDPTCSCGTGVCKGNILRALRAASPRTHLVHIGNGRVSDTCGALAADTAFAKDSLAEALENRGFPFIRFATLHDVIPHVAGILARCEG